MSKRFRIQEGESLLISGKKNSNYSNGKFSIWWTLITLGMVRKEIHTGWILFTNKRVIFCKRHWFKTFLLGPLTSLLPSKRILWEINIEDIESVSNYKCLGLFPTQRIHSRRFEGEKFDFGFSNKKMIEVTKLMDLKYND